MSVAASSSSLAETDSMSNVAEAQSAIPLSRGLAQLIAAVAGAVEAAFEVFAEAADMSAEARRRFPSAD
jgi:hypothetical protein